MFENFIYSFITAMLIGAISNLAIQNHLSKKLYYYLLKQYKGELNEK
ncbi:hypothetical protein [Cetobacterium sp.]